MVVDLELVCNDLASSVPVSRLSVPGSRASVPNSLPSVAAFSLPRLPSVPDFDAILK